MASLLLPGDEAMGLMMDFGACQVELGPSAVQRKAIHAAADHHQSFGNAMVREIRCLGTFG